MPMPTQNVSPGTSATAQQQPNQAGLPAQPPPLEVVQQMLENIVNTLRDSSAIAINPRLDPATVAALSARSVELQADSHTMSMRLDAYAQTGTGGLGVYEDLVRLGDNAQAYTQAVLDALSQIGENIQVAGTRGLRGLRGDTDDKTARENKRVWILFGLGVTAVVAGLGVFAVTKGFGPVGRTKPRFRGVIPAQ